MQNKVGATRAAACGPSCVQDRQKLRSRRGFIWAGMLAGAMATLLMSQAAAAAPATVEGTLETIVEDHPDHARTRHFLKTDDKGRVELRFARHAPTLRSGSRVRASGQLAGNVLALADSGSTSLAVITAAPLPDTTGELKTAVLLINFADDTSQPYTLAQVKDMVFNQVGGFLRENSFQKTWLSGDAFGWFTLPVAKTCDGVVINSYAHNAATNAGVDLMAYGRVIYVFPRNATCIWSGAANVGGTRPSIWINGRLTQQVVGHEFGHSLGLHHAHSMDCGAAAIGATCTTDEYGDMIDTMANNAAGHFSAFNKERLGWLDAGTQPAITTVQASGRYTIEAYAAAAGTLPKALKVPRGTDPVTGQPVWYYIEYRHPVGYDTVLASIVGSNFLNGLIVRSGSEADINSGTQLDMTPASSSLIDWLDSALPFGQSYVDAASGVTVVAVAGANGVAAVDITLNAPPAPCQRSAPTASLTGGTSTAASGAQLVYTLAVANRDSAACPAASFDLAASVPVGWAGALGGTRITASPGTSTSTLLTVTSAPGAQAGNYPVSVKATHGNVATLSGTGSATFTIAGSWSLSTATNQGSYRRGDTVVANARVMAGGAPSANIGVSFVFVKTNGSKVVKSGTTDAAGQAFVSLRIARKDPAGLWGLTASVAAAGQNAAAVSSFQVQ